MWRGGELISLVLLFIVMINTFAIVSNHRGFTKADASRQFSVADTGIANYTIISSSVTVVSLGPLKRSLLKRFVKVFHLTTVKHKEPQMQHRNDDRPIINQ